MVDRHSAIGAILQDYAGLAPTHATTPDGAVDLERWRRGFLAAVQLNRRLWKDTLNPKSPGHALAAPILSQDAASHGEIPTAVGALREHFQMRRYEILHPNTLAPR